MAQLNLDVLTPETAPENTRSVLADVKKKYGFQPNLYGVFAHSPAPLKGYLGLSEAHAAECWGDYLRLSQYPGSRAA
jgi:hypothetical protein